MDACVMDLRFARPMFERFLAGAELAPRCGVHKLVFVHIR
jgi:hypothetical protein